MYWSQGLADETSNSPTALSTLFTVGHYDLGLPAHLRVGGTWGVRFQEKVECEDQVQRWGSLTVKGSGAGGGWGRDESKWRKTRLKGD